MRKLPGFTIVELLIVIVVISILASISVVAYNGVTTRAEDSLIASKVHNLAKLFESYSAANSGLVPQANWACVGEPTDFPAENGYTAEWCHQPYQAPPIPNGSDHPIDATLNAKVRTLVARMPNSSLPEVDHGDGVKYRGILYDSSASQNGGKPVLEYHVKGVRNNCPLGIKQYSGATYTVCDYFFTTIKSETGT
jgi:prepilin-type N-terminal cleavage/methylation domain-containing protein